MGFINKDINQSFGTNLPNVLCQSKGPNTSISGGGSPTKLRRLLLFLCILLDSTHACFVGHAAGFCVETAWHVFATMWYLPHSMPQASLLCLVRAVTVFVDPLSSNLIHYIHTHTYILYLHHHSSSTRSYTQGHLGESLDPLSPEFVHPKPI